jgi:hypothetical protein
MAASAMTDTASTVEILFPMNNLHPSKILNECRSYWLLPYQKNAADARAFG